MKQMKHGMKNCCPFVSDECCFYDATEWILSLELFSVTVSRSADPYLLIKNSATRTKNRPSGVVAFAMKLLDGVLQCLTGLEGRHLCRGDLDGLAGVGIAAPTGAAPIFSNYVTPSQ